MTNWTELKRLAEEATQGDWSYVPGGDEEESWQNQFPTITANDGDIVGLEGFYSDKERDEANAAFIAAANPKTILALIAENERLREGVKGDYDLDSWLEFTHERDQLRDEVEALRKDAERWRFLCNGDHQMIIAQMTEFDGVCEIGCDPIEYDFVIDSMMDKKI